MEDEDEGWRMRMEDEDGGWSVTWGSSASLNDGEFLMRGFTIAASFRGEDGRLCQSLGQTRGHGRFCHKFATAS